jgi:hypothetical protein
MTSRTHRPHFIRNTKWPLAVDAQMESPIQCSLKVGDKVKFTNDYGVKFDGVITGFSPEVSYGRFVYWDNSAWWFPVDPAQMTIEQ